MSVADACGLLKKHPYAGVSVKSIHATRPNPIVEAVRQPTDDANPKVTHSNMVSDGYRVYFDEIDSGQTVSKQVFGSGDSGSHELQPTEGMPQPLKEAGRRLNEFSVITGH
jgi:hypothetical protein